jgi:hypothetical protein
MVECVMEDPFIKLKENIERSRKEREAALQRLDKLESDVQKFRRKYMNNEKVDSYENVD